MLSKEGKRLGANEDFLLCSWEVRFNHDFNVGFRRCASLWGISFPDHKCGLIVSQREQKT